jgi:hypothetical protein
VVAKRPHAVVQSLARTVLEEITPVEQRDGYLALEEPGVPLHYKGTADLLRFAGLQHDHLVARCWRKLQHFVHPPEVHRQPSGLGQLRHAIAECVHSEGVRRQPAARSRTT